MKYRAEIRVNGVPVVGRQPQCSSDGTNTLNGGAILKLKRNDIVSLHVVVEDPVTGQTIKTLAEGCMIKIRELRLN